MSWTPALEEPGASPVRGHPVIVERGRSQDYSYVLFFFLQLYHFPFLSSRCFIPVCPSCVQIAYSKFCVSVVSSIDSGLQDRILLPRTLKLFSASFHFKIRCNKRSQQFQKFLKVSLKFIFLFACNRDFYFENEA